MKHESVQDPLAVARTYHDAWSSKAFESALACFAPDVTFDVPINAYPTREAFGEALTRFGGMVEKVELLAELASEQEAVLLYDLQVAGIGLLRVAEHFRVQHGVIVALRQVHDTFALRAAGFAASTSAHG
jgi:hypothetical protein